jgi:hypothetical protein
MSLIILTIKWYNGGYDNNSDDDGGDTYDTPS